MGGSVALIQVAGRWHLAARLSLSRSEVESFIRDSVLSTIRTVQEPRQGSGIGVAPHGHRLYGYGPVQRPAPPVTPPGSTAPFDELTVVGTGWGDETHGSVVGPAVAVVDSGYG